MLIGYVRVSKSDGSQVLDLQKDALENAGVEPEHIMRIKLLENETKDQDSMFVLKHYVMVMCL